METSYAPDERETTAAATDTAACTLRAALGYAAMGCRVFPCRSRDKRPSLNDWPNQATGDPATIRGWWRRWPEANVAIVTGPSSGLFALDVDQHGADGETSLGGLVARYEPLPRTPEQRTAGGGRHIFFAYPVGRTVRNSACRLGSGLDVRGDGGYVVAPPSVHPSGRRYAWLPGQALGEIELADAPGWLLDLIHPPTTSPRAAPRSAPPIARTTGTRYALAALRREADAVATAPVGERNETLNRAAFALGRFVETGDLVLAHVVHTVIQAARAAGLEDREICRTVESGLRARLGGAL